MTWKVAFRFSETVYEYQWSEVCDKIYWHAPALTEWLVSLREPWHTLEYVNYFTYHCTEITYKKSTNRSLLVVIKYFYIYKMRLCTHFWWITLPIRQFCKRNISVHNIVRGLRLWRAERAPVWELSWYCLELSAPKIAVFASANIKFLQKSL